MARTLVIGLTESGTKTTVNEDTFSLGGRVYPDMITGSEERSAKSQDYTHSMWSPRSRRFRGGRFGRASCSENCHGSGRPDRHYKQPELDFQKFCRDLIKEAHARVTRQIKPRDNGFSGVHGTFVD